MGYKMDICQVAALRIRKMRLEKNMTIDDLAEKCDVSTQTIKLIEAGRRNFKIKTLYTIVSAFTLLVLFLVVFYTRWQQALPLALILVTLCVICEFTPPLIMSALIGNNLAQTIEITIDAAAFNLIASGIFYIVLRVGRFILNRIYGEKTPIYTKNNGWASIFPIVSIVFVYYIVYMGAVANTSQTTMMGGILYAFILISNIV